MRACVGRCPKIFSNIHHMMTHEFKHKFKDNTQKKKKHLLQSETIASHNLGLINKTQILNLLYK